jgi:hypothetical protein
VQGFTFPTAGAFSSELQGAACGGAERGQRVEQQRRIQVTESGGQGHRVGRPVIFSRVILSFQLDQRRRHPPGH